MQVQLSSRYPDLLPEATAEVRRFMDGMDGLVDIEDSRPVPGIEWELSVDPLAGRRSTGWTWPPSATPCASSPNGLTIDSYRPDDSDEEIDIVVRYPEHWRTIEQLDNLRVVTGSGTAVPVSNFVERVAEPKVGTLNRVAGQRVMTVKADVVAGRPAGRQGGGTARMAGDPAVGPAGRLDLQGFEERGAGRPPPPSCRRRSASPCSSWRSSWSPSSTASTARS